MKQLWLSFIVSSFVRLRYIPSSFLSIFSFYLSVFVYLFIHSPTSFRTILVRFVMFLFLRLYLLFNCRYSSAFYHLPFLLFYFSSLISCFVSLLVPLSFLISLYMYSPHFLCLTEGCPQTLSVLITAPGCHASITTTCATVNSLQISLSDNPSKTYP